MTIALLCLMALVAWVATSCNNEKKSCTVTHETADAGATHTATYTYTRPSDGHQYTFTDTRVVK